MDMVIEKLVTVVDSPLGLIAIVLIFVIANRLFSLEEWVRTNMSDTIKNNTEAITKMTDHCKARNGRNDA